MWLRLMQCEAITARRCYLQERLLHLTRFRAGRPEPLNARNLLFESVFAPFDPSGLTTATKMVVV